MAKKRWSSKTTNLDDAKTYIHIDILFRAQIIFRKSYRGECLSDGNYIIQNPIEWNWNTSRSSCTWITPFSCANMHIVPINPASHQFLEHSFQFEFQNLSQNTQRKSANVIKSIICVNERRCVWCPNSTHHVDLDHRNLLNVYDTKINRILFAFSLN